MVSKIITRPRAEVTEPELLALEPENCVAYGKQRTKHRERGWVIKQRDDDAAWAACKWCYKHESQAAKKFREKAEAGQRRTDYDTTLPKHLRDGA